MVTIKVRYGNLDFIIRNVPDWVKYIAIDEDKSIYGYEEIPCISDNGYEWTLLYIQEIFFKRLGVYKFNNCNWMDSLRRVKYVDW